jgi:transcriptional regulator with GAF, ATPase, and Fis domain
MHKAVLFIDGTRSDLEENRLRQRARLISFFACLDALAQLRAAAARAAPERPTAELRNLMERLVSMTPGNVIDAQDLPASASAAAPREDGPQRTPAEARRSSERDFRIARLRERGGNIGPTAEATGLAREGLSREIKSLAIEVKRG